MNKYLIVLLVLSVVGVFLYVRLRPYIQLARRFFGVVRDARRMNERQSPGVPGAEPRPRAGEKLARCPACGTWFPSGSAVTLRGDPAKYCSHACLERAADSPRRARKSAV